MKNKTEQRKIYDERNRHLTKEISKCIQAEVKYLQEKVDDHVICATVTAAITTVLMDQVISTALFLKGDKLKHFDYLVLQMRKTLEVIE